jgi:hypothetical protein
MFDKFKYRNVTKLIDHFDALLADVEANRDDYYGWQANGFLARHDYSDPKVQASLKKTDDWLAKAITIGRYPQKTDLENKQMGELLYEEWNGEKLTRPELLALIRKYPPEILETVLPCVMVMYLLRETDLEFDSETKAFGDFFNGWHHMVIYCD